VIGRAHVTIIISYHVLYRMVGSPAVMAEQCGHLAGVAEQVAVHVLPDGLNMGIYGAFDIATGGGTVTVRLETIEDVPSTASELVTKTAVAFERMLGAALPRTESTGLIRMAEKSWKAKA
jgi:Domain of unknown function (DUF5753)